MSYFFNFQILSKEKNFRPDFKENEKGRHISVKNFLIVKLCVTQQNLKQIWKIRLKNDKLFLTKIDKMLKLKK